VEIVKPGLNQNGIMEWWNDGMMGPTYPHYSNILKERRLHDAIRTNLHEFSPSTPGAT
jgi:hypothetical protein